MRLSEFASDSSVVVREGEFETLSLGYPTTGKHLVVLDEGEDPSPWPPGVSAVLSSADRQGLPEDIGIMVAARPFEALSAIHERIAAVHLYLPESPNDIDPGTKVHSTAVIAQDSVVIGKGCEIGPFAVISRGAVLGDGVRIGAGTVIGHDLPVAMEVKGTVVRLRPAGPVRIGSNVDIHSNCVVSRGLFDQPTQIDDEVKIDNLVTVGASARIGEGSMLVACANIGNLVIMGRRAWVGPNASVGDSVKVGDRAFISIGSTVVEDVGEGAKVTGNFAIDHQKFISFIKRIR